MAQERVAKAGVAAFVMRNREYLVAVKADSGAPALHALHRADEIREPQTVGARHG
ncbi:hypothetical protein ACFWIO_21655 [Streptomyces diastatochromogenes]|uniref:hypothetical protein n=1 Tax=Streptomyces diastatochromogenes TaxID=42236 RepID=UPI00365CD5FB